MFPRSLLRSTLVPKHALSRQLTSSARSSFVRPSTIKLATGGVSQQPGSKSFKELGKNAIEETKGIAQTLVGAVSGDASTTSAETQGAAAGKQPANEEGAMGTLKSDLDAVKGLAQNMPKHAVIWGALGLIPYAGTSLGTVYLAREASIAVNAGKAGGFDPDAALLVLSQIQQVQISYGAVLLSFLGAIHWGFEFSKYGGVRGNLRYAGGVVPCVIGWGSLLLSPTYALLTQWAGFFGTYYADMRATREGMTPKWYSTYRFWLTAIVGSSILLTLGGESYFGPDGATMKQRSDILKLADKPGSQPTGKRADLGEMRVEKVDESQGEGYVQFSKIDKEKEEQEAKEAEEKQAKEDQRAEEERTKGEREEKAKRARSQSGLN